MKKWLAPLALLIVLSSAAMAQWQVPNYSVPLGRGTGATGFKRAVPGDAGLPLTSNGAAADPTFQQAISSANKVIHVSTTGNDARDGRSWATAKLTIQAGVDTASTAGKVIVGAGTYTLSAPVYMRAGVALECVPGAIITQANAANLQAIVDFSGFFGGNTATGASIRYCTVDGNRTNNTGRLTSGVDNTRLVYFGNTDYVTIDSNIIRSGPGYGVHGSSQLGLTVSNNVISDTEAHSIFAVQVAGGAESYCHILNNEITYMLLAGIDGCVVNGNKAIGTLIGNVFDPLHVTISGTAVTWVSGPNFSFVKSGMLLIANNGAIQLDVKTVNSTTSLTLASTGGALVNNLAMIGTEDLIGILATSKTTVSNNYMVNGASFGLSTGGSSAAYLDGNVFANNVMEFNGKNGFTMLGDGGGAGGLGAQNNVVVGNLVINAIAGGLAGCPAGGGCLHSYVITGGTQANNLLDGNHAQDNLSATYTWLNVTGLAAGAVRVGNNNQVGAQNDGIYGGISSIALGAGWGSTAATSSIVSYGNSVLFTITANGAGIAANPTITVNTIATKPTQGTATVYSCKMTGGTGTVAALAGEYLSTPSLINIGYINTPGAGSTYIIVCN